MTGFRKIFLAAVLILLLAGCGKTNFVQWAAPRPEYDNLEQARVAIDEAKYDKAISLVNGDNSPEARIIYAEALLGKNNIDLGAIVEALDNEDVLDNPILKLEGLITDENLGTLLAVGDIFLKYPPRKKSDKIIGAIASLIAHTANLKQAFLEGTTYNNLNEFVKASHNDNDGFFSEYEKLASDTGNAIRYITSASHLINSTIDSEDNSVKEAIDKANNSIKTINTALDFSDKVKKVPTDNNTIFVNTVAVLFADLSNNADKSLFAGYAITDYDINTLKSKIETAQADPANQSSVDALNDYIEQIPDPNVIVTWKVVKSLFAID